jgi:hypothetical protein
MDPSDKHWDDGVEMASPQQELFLQAEALVISAGSQPIRHPSACHWDPFLNISITATVKIVPVISPRVKDYKMKTGMVP